MENKTSAQFSSRWGFVLSAVGSAVGMANVWGFPYKMATYGGSAFLIAYLIFAVLFSTIGLSAEYAIGRRSGTGTIGSYRAAWATRGKAAGRVGGIVGWLPLVGSLCIAVGYAAIIAYVDKGFLDSVTGTLMETEPGAWFDSFSGAAFSVVPFHVIVVIVTLLTLFVGAKGIEKSNKIMMPLFFLVFVVLAIRVAFLPGAAAGYKFMFTPDWAALTRPEVWIHAMGQAFFSLSVTGSGMIVYGAYLDKKEDVVKIAVRTALCDTIAAVVASLVIIPACVSFYGTTTVDKSAGLLFVTLPRILQEIPFGQVFAVVLFAAMIFAGISSLQNMFEAVSESLQHCFKKLNRTATLILIGAVCLGFGLFMEPIAIWGSWMDIVSIYIIPIGATIGALSWFWVMKKSDLLDEINLGTRRPHGKPWYFAGRFLYVPCAIVLCCVALILKVAF